MTAHRLAARAAPLGARRVAVRRPRPRPPALTYEEPPTAGKVEEVLKEAAIPFRRCAGTGIVADLGPEVNRTALRGDMDALPLEEKNGFEHRSTVPGRMHACGHDGHTTILLGTALALASVRDRLRSGVRLVFQPAEEGGAGAKRMADEGALDGVTRIFGVHNWPVFPVGTVGVRPGPMMAAAALFEMKVLGKGGHGSQPQEAKDPILAASQVVTLAQALVSRETHPLKPAVVTFGTIHGGTATNIIPDDVALSGTIRTLDDAQADALGARLEEVARGVCAAFGLRLEYRYHRYYPVTSNHPADAALVAEVGEELFGKGAVSAEHLPTMGAEDFSFFLQRVPGAYFFLGGKGEGRTNSMCHSADYDFNDDLILPGVRMYLRLLERTGGALLADDVPRG